jgi:hypothetical protein
MLLFAGCDGNHIVPRKTSGKSTPRLSMSSMPKTVCKYAKDNVYITKGKYGKHAKEAAFVVEGDNEPLTTRKNWPRMQGNNEPLATKG